MERYANSLSSNTTNTPIKLVAGADNYRHYLRAFIQMYRNLPVLWDTLLRDYTNRDKRAEAYEQLVPIYRYLKRDATIEDVKKKINTLRTNYRKELKVVDCARRSGSVHQPRCWTFHELDFLRNTEKFLAVNPNFKCAPNDLFVSGYADNSQPTPSSLTDVAATANYNFRTGCQTASPPNISEMFQKSFGPAHYQHVSIQKQEPETNPATSPSNQPTSNAEYNLPVASSTHAHAQSPQAQQRHQHDEHAVSDCKRQRLSSPSLVNGQSSTDTTELLNIACDYLAGSFPEEESIVRTWTHKLRRLQREQRLLAEKFINDILFEAESGTLHRGSMQINVFEPFVRFEEGLSIMATPPDSKTHQHAATVRRTIVGDGSDNETDIDAHVTTTLPTTFTNNNNNKNIGSNNNDNSNCDNNDTN